MGLKEIVLDGVKYLKADEIKKQEFDGSTKIVVLQRGWVLVGILDDSKPKNKLQNASVIRTWGTSKGLGELTDGPLSGTKLDKCNGVVEFNELTVVLTISASEEKWKKYL